MDPSQQAAHLLGWRWGRHRRCKEGITGEARPIAGVDGHHPGHDAPFGECPNMLVAELLFTATVKEDHRLDRS